MATGTTKTKGRASSKKPKWEVISYKQIEARRVELGYSKSALAEALGVTNSTFHNWRRGTTVPHPTQQEQIKETLDSLKPVDKTSKSTASTNGTKASTGRSKSSTKGRKTTKSKRASAKGGRRAPGGSHRAAGNVGRGGSTMPSINSTNHPLYPAVHPDTPGIAAITSAWISSQKKAPSAGSVVSFMRDVKGVLSEE